MARREVIVRLCDVPHDDQTDRLAAETVRFSVGTRRYTIDMCAQHAEDLYNDLTGWIPHARPTR